MSRFRIGVIRTFLFFIFFLPEAISAVQKEGERRPQTINRLKEFTKIVVAVEGPEHRKTDFVSPMNFFLNKKFPGIKPEPLLSYKNPESEIRPSRFDSYINLYTLNFPEADQAAKAYADLQNSNDLKWAYPVYIFEGDPRDLKPNDPKYSEQQSYFKRMEMEAAWDLTIGSPDIIVAVTDDGFDLSHRDLSRNWYVNSKEIRGNGIDDDANGYIDDVEGWNFADETSEVFNGYDGQHGTHVAGIIAAETHNMTGVCGMAGGTTLMPLKFYGNSAWTAEVIAKTYKYAADQGARIISTSYNVDGFVGDPIFEAALEYVYQKGLLQFNSAGNNYAENPPRQRFDQLLLVCSTHGDSDEKNDFSNWGFGVDLCAPGGDILSTVPHGSYEVMSGTSMATPQAAGLAALIWSLHPNWNAAQVAAQLLGTADSIVTSNFDLGGLLGAGRINARRALTETIEPPRIRRIVSLDLPSPPTTSEAERRLNSPRSFELELEGVFDPKTWTEEGALSLIGAGVDLRFGTSDDLKIPVHLDRPYRLGTNRLTVSLENAPAGTYQFRAEASIIKSPFGLRLDGDQDGKAGPDFVSVFNLK